MYLHSRVVIMIVHVNVTMVRPNHSRYLISFIKKSIIMMGTYGPLSHLDDPGTW